MLIPHDNEQVKSLHVSSSGLRVLLSLLLVAGLLLGIISIGFFVRHGQETRAENLARENQLLAAEVEQIRGSMASLAESLDSLAAQDEKFRVIAGLSSYDEEVRQVGIGGPGTPVLEEHALYLTNPEVGERVFAANYDLGTLMRRAEMLQSSMGEALKTLEENTERLAAVPSIMPSTGHLSSLFSKGRRHPVLRITRPHRGIDIAAPVGEAILAPAGGRVVFAGWKSGGYGNTVEIDHGYGYLTRFAHASRVLVRRGDRVDRGQIIAEVGATGLVTGPHLHYEVEVNGQQVDPMNFILEDAVPD
jgi:murein DD-endopeptidase MepM/ murein hydrolase activator NlpD